MYRHKKGIKKVGSAGKSFSVNVVNSYGLGETYSTLYLECESSHRQYVNKWAWLCYNKALGAERIGGLDLAHRS